MLNYHKACVYMSRDSADASYVELTYLCSSLDAHAHYILSPADTHTHAVQTRVSLVDIQVVRMWTCTLFHSLTQAHSLFMYRCSEEPRPAYKTEAVERR